mgnify:CR=1 FL=1
MHSKIAVGGDLLLSIVQAYMLAAHQQGLSAEEAKARFEASYAAFMDETAAPVEEVAE